MCTANDYEKLKNLINKDYSHYRNYRKIKLIRENDKYSTYNRSHFSKVSNRAARSGKLRRPVPVIIINTNCPDSKTRWQCNMVATLAHEFGHYLSFRKKESPVFVNNSYTKFNEHKKITKRDKKNIINEETRAWVYGFEFLKQNGFKIHHTMKALRCRCLMAYEERTESLLNLK